MMMNDPVAGNVALSNALNLLHSISADLEGTLAKLEAIRRGVNNGGHVSPPSPQGSLLETPTSQKRSTLEAAHEKTPKRSKLGFSGLEDFEKEINSLLSETSENVLEKDQRRSLRTETDKSKVTTSSNASMTPHRSLLITNLQPSSTSYSLASLLFEAGVSKIDDIALRSTHTGNEAVVTFSDPSMVSKAISLPKMLKDGDNVLQLQVHF